MSIQAAGKTIRIVGNAPVEDAEPLLAALQANPARSVDLSEAGHLHSAIIQLLIAVRPAILGEASYPFFSAYVLPLLDREQGSA